MARKQSSKIYFQGHYHNEIYFQGHYHDKMYIGDQLVWEKINEEWVDRALTCLTDVYEYDGYNYLIYGSYTSNKRGGDVIYENNMHLFNNLGLSTDIYMAGDTIYFYSYGSNPSCCLLNEGTATYKIATSDDYGKNPLNAVIINQGSFIVASRCRIYTEEGVLTYEQNSETDYKWMLRLKSHSGTLITSLESTGILLFLRFQDAYIWITTKDINGTYYLCANKSTDLVDVEYTILESLYKIGSRFLTISDYTIVDDKIYFTVIDCTSSYVGNTYNAYIVSYDGSSFVLEKNISELIVNRYHPSSLRKFGSYWFIIDYNKKVYLAESLEDAWKEIKIEYPDGITGWYGIAGMTVIDGTYHLYAHADDRVFRYDFEYGNLEDFTCNEIEYCKVKETS